MQAIMVDGDPTQELANKARAGDRAAFDDLVKVFRDRLCSSLRGWSKFQLTPKLDPEEILQETLLRAYQSIGRFEWRDDDAFFKWLCGIAKHVLAQASQRARQLVQFRPNSSVQRHEESPSKDLQRHERFDRLEAALEKLCPEHREVILLSRIDGLTSVEVAKRMNRSPAAVRQLLVRALRELKKHFGDTESFHLPDRRLGARGHRDD